MSDISQWDISASGNAVAAPNGWPNGQAPNTVKDTGREMMAAIRRQWNDNPWFNWGDTVSYVSETSFKVTGLALDRYVVNRRLRLNDASTLYGEVTSSVTSGSDTLVTMNLDSGALSASLSAVALSSSTPLGLPPNVEVGDNILINGDFAVAQRGTVFSAATTPANNDDTYLLDRWILLSDGNDVLDVDQETTSANLPTNSRAGAKLTVATANKRAGMLQIIENKNGKVAVGGVVSLSLKAIKGGSGQKLDKLRVGVVGWNGTADSVTSDLVANWESEGTDPSLAANWEYKNTPSDLSLSTGYKTFKIEAVAAGTTANNLGVFVWIENGDASAGETVTISDIQLNLGASAGKFDARPFGEELDLCKRYYEKSYNLDVAPGTVSESGKHWGHLMFTAKASTFTVHKSPFNVMFQTEKRSAPNVTLYSPVSGSSGNVRYYIREGGVTESSADLASSNWSASGTGTKSYYYVPANATEVNTGSKADLNACIEYHYVAESEL